MGIYRIIQLKQNYFQIREVYGVISGNKRDRQLHAFTLRRILEMV